MRTVLFLCTGNYYRSRFAEELFNARAGEAGLNWRAASRGLAIERGKDNVGPVSALVRSALAELGVVPAGVHRFPASCTVADFESADLIIALSDAEHRPLMLERYAEWHARTEFWDIEDVGLTPLPRRAPRHSGANRGAGRAIDGGRREPCRRPHLKPSAGGAYR